MIDPPKDIPNQIMPSMKPFFFGSRGCKGSETRLHSYFGEGFVGYYVLRKISHYLWCIRKTWATDKYALVFMIYYYGDNDPICKLQMRIIMMRVYIVHRNARFIGGADHGYREAGDMWFDPLISEHNSFAATLIKNHVAPMGPLLTQNMLGYRNPRAKRSEEEQRGAKRSK